MTPTRQFVKELKEKFMQRAIAGVTASMLALTPVAYASVVPPNNNPTSLFREIPPPNAVSPQEQLNVTRRILGNLKKTMIVGPNTPVTLKGFELKAINSDGVNGRRVILTFDNPNGQNGCNAGVNRRCPTSTLTFIVTNDANRNLSPTIQLVTVDANSIASNRNRVITVNAGDSVIIETRNVRLFRAQNMEPPVTAITVHKELYPASAH